jgi:hypothetical protein
MAAVSIMLTALLKNYPKKGNEINQIKPASGPRTSAIDVCRSRATLDVTSEARPKKPHCLVHKFLKHYM